MAKDPIVTIVYIITASSAIRVKIDGGENPSIIVLYILSATDNRLWKVSIENFYKLKYCRRQQLIVD